jgi:predicted type IV restriction endonuclease
MPDLQNDRVRGAVRTLTQRAGRYREQYRERGLGEENTKASLIEPILEALGWDIRDPDEVYREFRPNPKDNPVDYCLRFVRTTRLLIEAKGLGEDLSDRRWVAQVLGYATMAGAEWCVLTDGDEYRLYNASATVDADGKLFCRIKLTDGREDEAVNVLSLVSRANMEQNILRVLWNAHFVDRRVKSTLRELVDTADRKLVMLIRKRIPDLSPSEIGESIRRLDIRIEALEAPYEHSKRPKPAAGKPRVKKAPKEEKGTRKDFGIMLPEVIAAGLLSPPIQLFRKYKGQRLEATLLPDGKVEFQGTRYDSCSSAAEAARQVVVGRRMNTNGWDFWQYLDASGKKFTLFDCRSRLLAMRGRGATGAEG